MVKKVSLYILGYTTRDINWTRVFNVAIVCLNAGLNLTL